MPRTTAAIAAHILSIALATALTAQQQPPEAPAAATIAASRVATDLAFSNGADGAVMVRVHPRVRGGEPFVLEAGDHELAALIDRAATWLGRNYLTSASDFQQPNLTLTLQTELHLDADGLERVLGLALHARGFAIVTLSEELQLYHVISLSGPLRGEVTARARQMSPDEVIERTDRMEQVMTVVELEHINAVTAATATRPFFAQSGGNFGGMIVGTLGDNRSMLVQGWAPQVAQAIRLLRLADETAGRAAELERVQDLEQRLGRLERGEQPMPPRNAGR